MDSRALPLFDTLPITHSSAPYPVSQTPPLLTHTLSFPFLTVSEERYFAFNSLLTAACLYSCDLAQAKQLSAVFFHHMLLLYNHRGSPLRDHFVTVPKKECPFKALQGTPFPKKILKNKHSSIGMTRIIQV